MRSAFEEATCNTYATCACACAHARINRTIPRTSPGGVHNAQSTYNSCCIATRLQLAQLPALTRAHDSGDVNTTGAWRLSVGFRVQGRIRAAAEPWGLGVKHLSRANGQSAAVADCRSWAVLVLLSACSAIKPRTHACALLGLQAKFPGVGISVSGLCQHRQSNSCAVGRNMHVRRRGRGAHRCVCMHTSCRKCCSGRCMYRTPLACSGEGPAAVFALITTPSALAGAVAGAKEIQCQDHSSPCARIALQVYAPRKPHHLLALAWS
jgi:hypothetical protein